MEELVTIIKLYLIPGSVNFLLLGLVLGVTLVFIRGRATRWGKGILLTLTLSYLILSLPVVPATLEDLLSRQYEPYQVEENPGDIQAIVILGGGGTTYEYGENRLEIMSESTSLRVLEGVRLYQLIGPLPVFVSGGAAPAAGKLSPDSKIMTEALIRFGIADEHIIQESRSNNTFEQAIILGEILMDEGIESFILVTSPTHMHRSLSTFQAQGLSPTPAVSLQHPSHHPVINHSLLPSNDALSASHMAFRELMALIYYGLSGRMSADGN